MRAGLIVSCFALATACAAESPVDPGELELRDLLGISPETASAWGRDQRSAARRVIEGGLREDGAAPIGASLGTDPQRIVTALASIDRERAHHDAGALGLVRVAIGDGTLHATPRATTIGAHDSPPVELRLAGWDATPQLPERGLDVLSAIATDAGHISGPIIVSPAPRLAVVAGYLPATAGDAARLLVNPILLAALEPLPPRSSAGTGSPPSEASAPGNPYSFYGSIAECAAAQQARCATCVQAGSCLPVTDLGDGTAECTQLGANQGRGDFLICINLALAISSISSCATTSAPSCTQDPHASNQIASLEANANFLDNAACRGPLDACLAEVFGPSQGTFPGPGSDAGTTTSPPRDTSIDCGSACSGDDSNCDASNCDACSSGDGSDGGGCTGDSEDSCGSENSSGDCSGDSGGGCGGDSSGGCGGDSSGDCSGGGGDCSGGGGDCGGGGGDCNAGAKRGHRPHGRAGLTIVWAFLPVPFAARARRRAVRRRAVADYERAHGAPS